MLAINITNKIVNSEYLSGGLKSCPSSLQGSTTQHLQCAQPASSLVTSSLLSRSLLDNAASSAGLLITAVHRNSQFN
jgi:hypothetical protein